MNTVTVLASDYDRLLAANREMRFANRVNSDEWRQRVESLEAASREKDAEIERLKAATQLHNDSAVEAWRLTHKWVKRVFDLKSELSSLRASGGEKWIEIKEGCKMPTHDQKVLTYSDDMGCRIIPFGTSVKGMPPHVTHWQPLPAPPTLPTEKE